MKRSEWLAIVVAAVVLVGGARIGAADDEDAARYQKSVELETAGKYKDALSTLEGIRGSRTNTYMFHLRRGWLLYLTGEYDKAIDAYTRATKEEPLSIEARLGLMLPQLAARKWLDAVSTGRGILKLDAGNYLANSRVAYAYYNLGRWKDAEIYYRTVLQAYPGDTDMRSGYAWCLFKLGRHSDAKREFRAILEVAPKHAAAIEGIKLCP
jgi:tetratricopeptide (TPR) repeat protein